MVKAQLNESFKHAFYSSGYSLIQYTNQFPTQCVSIL